MTTEERKSRLFAQPSAAKEVYRPDGHYLNGHIIVKGPDGLWHMYYAPMVPGDFPNSNHHATSEDLLTWTHHGSVLEHGGPGDCDAYEVSDGCIVQHEGRWYLLYNARPYLGASRRFGMAVSDDLWSWTKLPGDGSPWFIPDPEVTGWREEGMMECKDPTIIYQDGTYYLYYIYQKMVEPYDDPLKQTHTGINLATSTDLVDWRDHGAVVEDRWITNPLCGPWGYEAPRAVQHDGKIYLFAMYYQGLQYTVGDDPFNFGPWRVMGHWHAPVFIRDEEKWYITHAYRPFGKPSTRGSKGGPYQGLYIAGLDWSEGVPVPMDLQDVMEDWPWARGDEWPKMRSRHAAIEATRTTE